MKPTIPIGKAESSKLEFKAAAAMRDLSSIGREVVAFLNAKGGDLWVGIGEHDGVAAAIEKITDPQAAKDRVWNHLVDSVEPPPVDDEVVIEVVEVGAGASILRIRVVPDDAHKPFALLKGNTRLFVVRRGARVDAMTREEIREALAQSTDKNTTSQPADFGTAREAARRSERTGLWMRIQPHTELDLQIQGSMLESFLRDARATGNRAEGWTFLDDHASLTLTSGRRELSSPKGPSLTVSRSGAIEYRAPILWLWHGGPENSLYPLTLIERVTSVFRLARAVYSAHLNGETSQRVSEHLRVKKLLVGKHDPTRRELLHTPVLADAGILGARGLRLPPYSPREIAFRDEVHLKPLEVDELFIDRPVSTTIESLSNNPDAVAFKLISRLYEAFGYTEEMIPREFDRKSMHLILPI